MDQLRITKAAPGSIAAGPDVSSVPQRGTTAALSRQGVRARGQRGSVSLGMAVVLALLLLSLAVPLFLGRAFWYYSVAHKAALDAARYLASASGSEMLAAASEGREARGAAGARLIAEAGTAALRTATEPRAIQVQCGTTRAGGAVSYGDCGTAVPDTVRVNIGLSLSTSLLPAMGLAYSQSDPLYMTTVVTLRYAGNRGGDDGIALACC